ncbi:MAG: hypothetical protein RIQ81_2677 [Pseudomonadota bacterium]
MEHESSLAESQETTEPVRSGRTKIIRIAAVVLVVGVGAAIASRYFSLSSQDSSNPGEPGDEFLVDSFEEGIFRQLEQGDYPQIIVEDQEGKMNAYGCSDGCPPLDQDPEAYLNRSVRVYLRNQTTPGNEDAPENGVKVVVRVELLP